MLKMPNENPLVERMQAGETCIGAWLLSGSSDIAEVMAIAGFDFLIVDHEHGQATIADAANQIRAIKQADCQVIFRTSCNSPVEIKRILDLAPDGILVPNIESAEAARQVVHACRYPPEGSRGAFLGMRATSYGLDLNYYSRSFGRFMVAVQIESPGGIDALPEIGGVEGIDVLFIGPRDLSASLGVLNQFEDCDFRKKLARAESGIPKTGKAMGSILTPNRTVGEMSATGHRLVVVGSDFSLLAGAAQIAVGRGSEQTPD